MKTMKKLFFLLLVLVMAASLFPTAALAARTGISTIIAVSEDIQTPTLGEKIQRPFITVTSGWPAYFDDDASNTWGWERKNASTGYWERYTGGYFTPGTWRYSNQIRIDGVDGGQYTHYLDYPFTVTVNGEEWTTSTVVGGYYEADVSYGWAYSPEYVIPETRTYTVWFNTNGHGTAPASQTNLFDTPIIEPEEPVAEGYRFDGWYDSPECVNQWNFDVAISRDITLYAKWVPAVTEISFGGMTRPVVGQLPPTNMTVYNAEGATRTLSKWHIYNADTKKLLSEVSVGKNTLSVEAVKVSEQMVYVYVMVFSADEGYEFSDSLRVLHNGQKISKATAASVIRNPAQTCWYVTSSGDIRVHIVPRSLPIASLPEPEPLVPDVDDDGDVDVTDLVVLMKHIAGVPSGVAAVLTDLNEDSATDILDVIFLVRYLADNA